MQGARMARRKGAEAGTYLDFAAGLGPVLVRFVQLGEAFANLMMEIHFIVYFSFTKLKLISDSPACST